MEAAAWISRTSMQGVTSDGRTFAGCGRPADLIAAGLEAGARVYYLCGDPLPPELLLADLQRRGWQDAGSRLTRERFLVRARNPKLRRSVTILPASGWLGEGDYSHLQARAAMVTLAAEIAQRFDRTRLWLSPGRTGAEAWRNTARDQFPPLPEGLQYLLRHTAGQGRFECCPVAEELPALYRLDQRLAYVAGLARVETGDEWRHEERPAGGWPDADGPPADSPGWLHYTPARYRIRCRVPQNWSHVGLLPCREGTQTSWPATAGTQWECWADAREVHVALAEGWRLEILERVYAVKPAGRATYYRPLKTWGERMVRLYGDLQADPREALRPLWRAAVRNLLLHTIGWMAMRPTLTTREVDTFAEVPDEPTALVSARETAGGAVLYEEMGVLSPQAARVAHPELAAQVWGSRRQHLLRGVTVIGGERREHGALTLPRASVVGMALDCLYLTHNPGWADDGRPGRYRAKHYLPGPLPAPGSMADLYALYGETGEER